MTRLTTGHAVTSVEPLNRFLDDVVTGLSASPKRLASKYFYDERGSQLFEQICELDEYYLTRAELAIMGRHVVEMAAALGRRVLLIEPGSGASIKVRLLLKNMHEPLCYAPVDISGDHLLRWAHLLREEIPGLPILPVHADFMDFDLPLLLGARRRVIYFPGSTIGNLTPQVASAWLSRMARVAGEDGGLLIGVDLKKDASVLEAAYNDSQGLTAAFNLNVLERIRKELEVDLDVSRFRHRAIYNEAEGRVEMHLVSTVPQTIVIDDTEIRFAAGETIHTENSYKYDIEQFDRILNAAGWQREACWTDDEEYFTVQYCVRSADRDDP